MKVYSKFVNEMEVMNEQWESNDCTTGNFSKDKRTMIWYVCDPLHLNGLKSTGPCP